MKLLAWVAAAFVAWMVLMVMAISAALGSGEPLTGPESVPGIPADYLALYVQAADDYKLDWAILAAIGKIESDHGRLDPPCATSSAGARGPMQFLPSTWSLPGIGKGGDICDPVDAIPAAARYLVAGGAPRDYHAAILSYNHAEWYYRDVMVKANEYRAMVLAPEGQQDQTGPLEGTWIVPVPGTGESCDARIVPNVMMILRRFHATLTACYAPTGHEPSGEHPLGLAVDLVPTTPTSWAVLGQLARFAGWKPSCAATGCAGQTGTAFRFVGWNGYPGHGAGDHLHLSWDHGPGKPAAWVRLVADG